MEWVQKVSHARQGSGTTCRFRAPVSAARDDHRAIAVEFVELLDVDERLHCFVADAGPPALTRSVMACASANASAGIFITPRLLFDINTNSRPSFA